MSLSMEDRGKIDLAVSNVAAAFFPDVLRIGWVLGENYYDSPAIYFRILTRPGFSRLSKLCGDLQEMLREAVDVDAMGLLAYHDYRSVPEPSWLREPEWDEAA
jgi:hypothetical protein